MKLIPNIGPTTRIAYVVTGLVLIAAAVFAPFSSRAVAVVVGLLGLVPIVEGAIGF